MPACLRLQVEIDCNRRGGATSLFARGDLRWPLGVGGPVQLRATLRITDSDRCASMRVCVSGPPDSSSSWMDARSNRQVGQ